jgi:hypothetical protein
MGKDRPLQYFTKKSSTGSAEKGHESLAPLLHGDVASYGSGLDPCFEAQNSLPASYTRAHPP